MDEKSTTDAPDQTSGGDNEAPTPDVSEQPTSAEQESQEKQAPTEATPEEAPADDIAGFAKSQGFTDDDLQNPAVLKALKVAKDNKSSSDKNFQAKRQAEKQLEQIGNRVLEDETKEFDDPLEEKVHSLEKQQKTQDWKATVAYFMARNPEALEHVETMDQLAEERPHLSTDLDTLYELALAKTVDIDSAREAGRREEREQLAKATQAAPPASSATQQEETGGEMSLDLIQQKGGDRDWYLKNKDKINAFLRTQ